MDKAWELIQEVEDLGGMTKAIETGLPKMRIEEAAARRQARIDSGKEVIVGINKYKYDQDEPIDFLTVDNQAVRESQVARLNHIKSTRNQVDVEHALDALQRCAETGEGQRAGTGRDCGPGTRYTGRDFIRSRKSVREVPSCESHHCRYLLFGKRRGSRIPEGPPNGQ